MQTPASAALPAALKITGDGSLAHPSPGKTFSLWLIAYQRAI